MLVLSRKPGERIFVGNDITITVTQIDRSGRVRIGIDAPKSVLVIREELKRNDERQSG